MIFALDRKGNIVMTFMKRKALDPSFMLQNMFPGAEVSPDQPPDNQKLLRYLRSFVQEKAAEVLFWAEVRYVRLIWKGL